MNSFQMVVATQIFFIFTPKIGEDFQFHSYFSDGIETTNQFSDGWKSLNRFGSPIRFTVH